MPRTLGLVKTTVVPPDFTVEKGMVLVVMGELDNIERLREMVPQATAVESYR